MSDNKFLVEFVVNFRWALHFFLEELLYTTESNYSVLVGEATNVLDAISLASFTNISSLASVPLGILQLAKEASIYLLVAEGILGSSPPTTHSFLLQHKGSSLTSSAVRREKSDTMHRGPYGVGVNRSTESATVRTAPSSDCSVTSQTIGSITDLSYFETPMSSQTGRKRPQRDDQAMFLLVRWLVSENILPTSELSFTLEIQPEDYEEHTRPTGSGIPPRREGSKRSKSPTFRLHNRMATRLAQLVPFYLGAHVIVSRALLFTHCSRLLYSEDVVEHIKKLRPRVSLPQGNTISVEEALLRWLQTVVFLHLNEAETEKRSKAPNATYGPQLSSNLRALYNQLEQSGPHQFCTLLQDGVLVLLALALYRPDMMRVKDIAFPEGQNTNNASSTNWLFVLQRAPDLKIWVGLHPEEIIVHGSEALSLHVLRFAQEWFAVLATHAEEDSRVHVEEEQMARVQYPTRKEDPYSSLNSSIALRSISSSLTQAIRVRKSTEEMRDSATRVSRSSPPPSTVSSAKPSEQSGSPLQRRRRAPYVTGSAGGNNFSVESDVEPLRPLSHKTTSVNVSLSSRTAGQETPEETVFDNLSYSSPPFGTVSYPQRESPADRRRVTAQGEVHTPRPGYAELTAQTFDVSDATVDASKSRISPGLAPTPKDSVNASIVPPPAELLPNTQSGEQDPYDENEEVFIIREVPPREAKTHREPAPLSPSPTPPVEESPSIPHTRNSTTGPKTEQTNSTDTMSPSEVPLPSSTDPVPLRDSYDYGPESASIDVDATPSRISYAGSMQSSISEVVGSENATRWVDDSWMSSVSRPGLQGTPQSVRRQLKVLEDALGNKDNESLEETVQRQQALIRDLMERLQSCANSRATSQGSSVYFNETMRSQRSTRSRSRRARLFDDTNATMESQMPTSVMGSYVTNNSAQLAETDISSQENSTLSKLD